ncbi:MAG: ASCH domain-containing protein [Acidobacteria bacterium]|nr:ASCH domain-containing protein [Acidobacteriota bacterium]
MKGLSVRQPWAWAIMYAGKDIENRNWPTRVRGRIAIHASKTMLSTDYFEFQEFTALDFPDLDIPSKQELICGSILGTVEIADCVIDSDSPWFVGFFGFVLRNPRPLEKPIPFNGKLGFFDIPDDLIPERL